MEHIYGTHSVNQLFNYKSMLDILNLVIMYKFPLKSNGKPLKIPMIH